MKYLFIFFVFTLSQLSLYFYLKGRLYNFKFINLNDYNYLFQKNKKAKVKSKLDHKLFIEEKNQDLAIKDQVLLNKSLRHLEFISEFELYLEDKNYKKFPIEFLQEFEKIKIEAQLSTLYKAKQLSNNIRNAA